MGEDYKKHQMSLFHTAVSQDTAWVNMEEWKSFMATFQSNRGKRLCIIEYTVKW